MRLPENYRGDFAVGVSPNSRNAMDTMTQMAVSIHESVNDRVAHERKMIEIARQIDDETNEISLDDAVYNFVREWSEGGTIKELKMSMFGLSGRGGYWYMPKLQERIRIEPDMYGLIMGTLWSSFLVKSEKGGQFNLDLFDTLMSATGDLYPRLKSSEVGRGLQEVMIAAVKRGLNSHDSLHARLKARGIQSESLWDFYQLDVEMRDELFIKTLSALSVPKTPQE